MHAASVGNIFTYLDRTRLVAMSSFGPTTRLGGPDATTIRSRFPNRYLGTLGLRSLGMIARAGTQARRQESQIPFAEERNRRVIAGHRTECNLCAGDRLCSALLRCHFRILQITLCISVYLQPRPSSDAALLNRMQCTTWVMVRIALTQKRLWIGHPRTRRRVDRRSRRNRYVKREGKQSRRVG